MMQEGDDMIYYVTNMMGMVQLAMLPILMMLVMMRAIMTMIMLMAMFINR